MNVVHNHTMILNFTKAFEVACWASVRSVMSIAKYLWSLVRKHAR